MAVYTFLLTGWPQAASSPDRGCQARTPSPATPLAACDGGLALLGGPPMSRPPRTVGDTLSTLAECITGAASGDDDAVHHMNRLPGRMLVAVGRLRDAYLCSLVATGAAEGSIGQRRGAVRSSWAEVCDWVATAVGTNGITHDHVECLRSPALAQLSAAVSVLLHFRSTDLCRASERAATSHARGVEDVGLSYTSWPPWMADYRTWQVLLAWTGCTEELAVLADALGRARGCHPLAGPTTPGARVAANGPTVLRLPLWSCCAMTSAAVAPSWLNDVLDAALPSSRRIVRRREGARRQRASPLTPFEQVLWLSRVIHLTRESLCGQRHTDTCKVKRGADVCVRTVSGVVARSVRALVRAWDALARQSRFASAEEMLAPYVLWSPTQLRYEALVGGGTGRLAPLAQLRDLFHGLVPSAVRGSVDAEALGRSPAADEQLRMAAKIFLEHLDTVTANKDV